jgi:hypothetical protein
MGGFIPVELLNADKALAEARNAGKHLACPEEYNAALALRDDAFGTYGRCNTKTAIALANDSMAKVEELCPGNDSDGDGVMDDLDQCPNTPEGVKVDAKGCPLDTDGDGVYDYLDQCPNTPQGVKVDAEGCPLDTDGDGVYDYLDQCPDTPPGIKVDAKGCPLDADGDGVYDYLDKCPNTPQGANVDSRGCWVLKGVHFDTAKWNLRAEAFSILDEVISILKKNPSLKVEVQDTRTIEDQKDTIRDFRRIELILLWVISSTRV